MVDKEVNISSNQNENINVLSENNTIQNENNGNNIKKDPVSILKKKKSKLSNTLLDCENLNNENVSNKIINNEKEKLLTSNDLTESSLYKNSENLYNVAPNMKDSKPKITFEAKIEENKNNKKKQSIKDFSIEETLGKGAYAKVVRAVKQGKEYAIKIISKKFIEKYEKTHEVHIERQVLTSLNHRNIIKIESTFQDQNNLYFVLEYCPNKDLSNFLKLNVILSNTLSQFYAAELVYTLEYLRKMGIAHRDLKPENIMLDKYMKIKLVSNIFNNID